MREHFKVPMSSMGQIASLAYGSCMDSSSLIPSLPLSEYSSLLSQWMSSPLVRLSIITIASPPYAHLSLITPFS